MGQIYTVVLPDIGEGVVEGEVIEWLKKVNDPLKQDEPVVVVMTDKATVELPAPYPGTLAKQYVKPGEKAQKNHPLYEIALGEGVVVVSHKKEEVLTEKRTEVSVGSKAATAAPCPASLSRVNGGAKALSTPPIRHLAGQLGIDINTVAGTGKEGRVTAEDLQSYCKSMTLPSPSKTRAAPPITQSTPLLKLEGDEEIPLIGIRKLTAEKMVESTYIIPHFSYFDQLDATRLIALRKNLKEEAEREGIKLTYIPFILRALSLSLTKFPQVNASVDLAKNSLVLHKQHNIGIAISSKNGLIVPVMKQVQKLKLADIIRQFDTLKTKALSSKLEPSAMQDSTITLSNFGALGNGGHFATPIINYPEIAILGTARIKKQPTVRGNELVVRDLMNLSWSFDHRVIDGDAASAFSQTFCTLIENPSRLL